jgi:hypothetical protein
MNTQRESGAETSAGARPNGDSRNRIAGGAMLIGGGLLLLASQIFTLGVTPLLILGVAFTLAGLFTRSAGWFIPGGVLNGIGLGALIVDSGLVGRDSAEGGAFLLTFALGWLSIYALTRLFTAHPQGWTLIPAAVMALIGGPLLLGEGGEALLETAFGVLAYVWPLALIGAGVVFLLRTRRG